MLNYMHSQLNLSLISICLILHNEAVHSSVSAHSSTVLSQLLKTSLTLLLASNWLIDTATQVCV